MNDRAASSGGSGAPKPDPLADRDATGKTPPDKPKLPARFTDEDLVDITPKKKLPARLSEADLAGVRDEPRTRLRGPIEVAGISPTRPAPLGAPEGEAARKQANPPAQQTAGSVGAPAARPVPTERRAGGSDGFERAPGAPRKPAGPQSFEAADVQGMRDEIHHRRLSKLSLDNIFSRGLRRAGAEADDANDDPPGQPREGERRPSDSPDVIDVQVREVPDRRDTPPGRGPTSPARPAAATGQPDPMGAAAGAAKGAPADPHGRQRAQPSSGSASAAPAPVAASAIQTPEAADVTARRAAPERAATTAATVPRAGAQTSALRPPESAHARSGAARREVAPNGSAVAGSIRPPAWLIRECVLALLGAAGLTFLVAEAYGLYGHWGVVPLWSLIVFGLHRWSKGLQRRGSLRMAMAAAVVTNLSSVALVATLERAIGWTGGAAATRDARAAAAPSTAATLAPSINWPALAATSVFGVVAWLNFRRLARPIMLVPLLVALWVALMQAGVWVMTAHSLRTLYLAQVSAAFGLTTVLAGEWLRRRIVQRNAPQNASSGAPEHALPDFSSWPQHLGILTMWLGLWALWPRTALGHGALGLANVAFAFACRYIPRRMLVVLGVAGAAIHFVFAAMLLQHPDWNWLVADPLEWLEPWASLLVR